MAKNMAAWLTEPYRSPLVVGEAPYPQPGQDEIVIKNAAVAINPVDWKQQTEGIVVSEYPYIMGCDVAGTVAEVGSGVSSFKVGDRVIGQTSVLVHGPKYGAFQHFVLCKANVACKLPDFMPFEIGVVVPLAVNTAAMGFYSTEILDLPLPTLQPRIANLALLIYGGTSSVGMVAIQLAKLSGVFVVATASKKNYQLVKDLGADVVLDYNSPHWTDEAVKALHGKQVKGAYDCISHEDTMRACSEVVRKAGADAPTAVTNFPPEGVPGKLVFGANLTKHDKLATAIWTYFLPRALEEKMFVPKPDAEVAGAGLEKIQTAVDMLKKGVSGRKLVVTLP